MSVSDPTNSSIINCTIVELYTQSHFLKLTMVTQGMVGIISILSISLTVRKILTTVMIDRAFKEYLLACYAMHFLQASALAILQTLLLTTHLVSAPCKAYIPARVCLLLRITAASVTTLPYLNVALTVFRFLVLRRKGGASWREWVWLYRGLQLTALLIGLAFQFYKFHSVNMEGYVVYCIGNFKDLSTQLLQENVCMSICEAFSIIFSTYIFRSYKRSGRSFKVNCSLLRRQAIQTFHLFIPFSLIQACAFWAFAGLTALYRAHFGYLPEPQYSAGSGLVYISMYFTMCSPWLVYFILRREEKKRIKGTRDLLAREKNRTAEHFAMANSQWAKPSATTENEQTTKINLFLKFIQMQRNGIVPVKKGTYTAGRT